MVDGSKLQSGFDVDTFVQYRDRYKQLKEGMKSQSIRIDFIPSAVFTDIFFLHGR